MEGKFSAAQWPVPLRLDKLTGRIVELEPMAMLHVAELAEAGSDPRVWEFTTSRGDSREAMQSYVSKQLRDWESGVAAPFAVRLRATGRIVGCTRLKELERIHRHGIVGSWYAPEAWRSGANLEAKLLLLGFAFETLKCIRVEFHADSNNERSRKSLEKLGTTFEGVLRAHQLTRRGTLRDSAIYSVLESEWPAVREGIVRRLR